MEEKRRETISAKQEIQDFESKKNKLLRKLINNLNYLLSICYNSKILSLINQIGTKHMRLIKTLGNCLDNHLTHIYLKDSTEYWIKTKFRFFPVNNLIKIGEKYHIPVQIIVDIAKHTDLDIHQLSSHPYYQQEYLKLLKETDERKTKFKQLNQQYLKDLEDLKDLQNKAIQENLDSWKNCKLKQLVSHDNPNLRLIAANSLLLTPDQVQQLVNDNDPHVRAAMALSPLLTMKQFTQLSKDEHYMVKGLAASSQFITMDKMEYLIQNGNFYIKSSIARSPYLDEYPNLVKMLKLENDKRILRLLDYIGL